MATDFTFLIPLGWEQRDERLAFARQHHLGVEITAFIGGSGLNDSMERSRIEDGLARDLSEFTGLKTMHGAFLDLALHSTDDEIAALSRRRIERDLQTATRLSCDKIVFHLGFNPLVDVTRYRGEILKAQTEFWSHAISQYSGVTICLENQWEPDWSIFAEIFEILPHPRLGMCLDVAHAHVNGHYGPDAWVRAMGSDIQHMHWNDNMGDRDSHLPVGDGNMNWPSILTACAIRESASVTLEMWELAAIRRSLSFLERNGVATGFMQLQKDNETEPSHP